MPWLVNDDDDEKIDLFVFNIASKYTICIVYILAVAWSIGRVSEKNEKMHGI